MLDLGALQPIQSIVEHEHCGKAPTANQLVSKIVMKSYNRLDATNQLSKIVMKSDNRLDATTLTKNYH